jgi:hypothetical protein
MNAGWQAAGIIMGVLLLLISLVLAFRWRTLERRVSQSYQHADRLYRELLTLRTVSLRKPTQPIIIKAQDFVRSPFTGFTRNTWRGVATGILENVLQYTDGMQGSLTLPHSTAAGYPRLNRDGTIYGLQESYLESFARTLLLATPLMSEDAELSVSGRQVSDYYAEFLMRGVSGGDEAMFGLPNGSGPRHHLVEAAMLATCLHLGQRRVWNALSARDQRRVVRWLEQVRDVPVVDNNWHWFRIIVHTFLKQHGGAFSESVVRTHLDRVHEMYVDAGWFRDGDKFDFYSGWAMQFYPAIWMLWAGDEYPKDRELLTERNDRFLQSFVHVFARDGVMPVWGRSVIYRFASISPIAAAHLRATPAIDPGFARRLSSGCLAQFVQNPGFLKNGIITLGFQGEQPDLVDSYSGVASPYWCAKAFVSLLLPETHAFWSATENEGFWSTAPSRYEFGRTGLWAEHDEQSGETKLYAPDSGPPNDSRYSASPFDTAAIRRWTPR